MGIRHLVCVALATSAGSSTTPRGCALQSLVKGYGQRTMQLTSSVATNPLPVTHIYHSDKAASQLQPTQSSYLTSCTWESNSIMTGCGHMTGVVVCFVVSHSLLHKVSIVYTSLHDVPKQYKRLLWRLIPRTSVKTSHLSTCFSVNNIQLTNETGLPLNWELKWTSWVDVSWCPKRSLCQDKNFKDLKLNMPWISLTSKTVQVLVIVPLCLMLNMLSTTLFRPVHWWTLYNLSPGPSSALVILELYSPLKLTKRIFPNMWPGPLSIRTSTRWI